MPQEGSCVVLRKLGVPEVLVDIIKSFHDDMKARIRLGQTLLEEINVNNGLCQGCTMVPIATLFNLYAGVYQGGFPLNFTQ